MLGVPCVADRIAQTVVAARLEKVVEPIFHPGSYGYRPGRSALDAVAACRKRCWRKDWVIDLDVEKFFDSVRWDLIVKAVQAHTDLPWVVLYVKRWLAAPLQLPDGTMLERDRGTPQGSSVSPVLANLFMHYAFDAWLAREFPAVEFERFADDAVVHCATYRQAQQVLAAIGARMEQVGLRLHPAKTRIVYCQDGQRRGSHEHTSFTFLGFTFRARAARGKNGKKFTSFLPAVSKDAQAKMSAQVRRWRLHLRTWHTIGSLAREINPVVRGWMQYYGAFYRSALLPLLRRVNSYLMRWLRKKYKRLASKKKARACWNVSPPSTPGSSPTGHGCPIPGGQDDRSRVTGDCYARICGSPGARSPRATRPKTEVSRVLSASTWASSCAFISFAAAAPASCANCSWRLRSAASARSARRSARSASWTICLTGC